VGHGVADHTACSSLPSAEKWQAAIQRNQHVTEATVKLRTTGNKTTSYDIFFQTHGLKSGETAPSDRIKKWAPAAVLFVFISLSLSLSLSLRSVFLCISQCSWGPC